MRFFFFDDEYEDDLFDDESENDGSGSGLSGTCNFSFSENSVGRVSGLVSFSRVIGIFPFLLSHLVDSLEYFHLFESVEYFDLVESIEYFDLVESIKYFPAQKHS